MSDIPIGHRKGGRKELSIAARHELHLNVQFEWSSWVHLSLQEKSLRVETCPLVAVEANRPGLDRIKEEKAIIQSFSLCFPDVVR